MLLYPFLVLSCLLPGRHQSALGPTAGGPGSAGGSDVTQRRPELHTRAAIFSTAGQNSCELHKAEVEKMLSASFLRRVTILIEQIIVTLLKKGLQMYRPVYTCMSKMCRLLRWIVFPFLLRSCVDSGAAHWRCGARSHRDKERADGSDVEDRWHSQVCV